MGTLFSFRIIKGQPEESILQRKGLLNPKVGQGSRDPTRASLINLVQEPGEYSSSARHSTPHTSSSSSSSSSPGV